MPGASARPSLNAQTQLKHDGRWHQSATTRRQRAILEWGVGGRDLSNVAVGTRRDLLLDKRTATLTEQAESKVDFVIHNYWCTHRGQCRCCCDQRCGDRIRAPTLIHNDAEPASSDGIRDRVRAQRRQETSCGRLVGADRGSSWCGPHIHSGASRCCGRACGCYGRKWMENRSWTAAPWRAIVEAGRRRPLVTYPSGGGQHQRGSHCWHRSDPGR